MNAITAELLTIGDEILYGQITDTNSQWMSVALTNIGIKVVRKTSVADQEGEILYEEIVTGVNITKNFRLNKDEINGGTVSFEVSRVSDPVITKIKIQGDLAKQ